MSEQANIDDFFRWITDQAKEIDKLPKHFRRILLLSLLDTLSKCAFPKERLNRKRFVKLIDCYSDWEYKDYVSLPQLRYLLFKVEKCQDLKKEVESRISKWPHGRILRLHEADPRLEDIDRLKYGKCEKLIAKARYAPLLWKMRNSAVHEFRRPGKGWAFSNDNSTPYYHGCLDEKGAFESWELCIPCEVISKIVLQCSNRLKSEFEQKGLDPYNDEHFKFGSSWYP